LDGAIAKDNIDIEEFQVPEKLKTLWRNKDYGRYAMPNGQMPLAFWLAIIQRVAIAAALY